MARGVWLATSVFIARVFGAQAAAAHALLSKVPNALEDLDAARVQNAAVPARIVVAQAQNAGVVAQNVVAVDLTAAVDHDEVGVHYAGAFPHAARALSGKVVAHNCAQVDADVARGPRFAPGVQVAQIGRGDPFLPAAGSFPCVPVVHFVQADLFCRASQDVP